MRVSYFHRRFFMSLFLCSEVSIGEAWFSLKVFCVSLVFRQEVRVSVSTRI